VLQVDFAFVPAEEPWAAQAVVELREYGIASVWAVGGVLGRVAKRVGWTDALRMTAAAPGELAVLLGEALHEAMEEARAGRTERADALLVADDLAGASGPLVSRAIGALREKPPRMMCLRSFTLTATCARFCPRWRAQGSRRCIWRGWRADRSQLRTRWLAARGS
jgi:hypothetical protein